MSITTGLSVPVFNVLKYFFLIVFIETIARGALNNIYIFFRKLDLYKGRSSPLSRSTIDRYNLLQVSKNRSYSRIGFWAILIICFYVVEIMFEFSSDAERQMTVRADRKLVYNATYSSCEPFDVLRSFVAVRIIEMASSCVDVTENKYTLYKPLWIRDEYSGLTNAPETALCVKVPENKLQSGKRIYEDRRFREGTRSWEAVADLVSAIRASSRRTYDDRDREMVVISVSSSDMAFKTVQQLPANQAQQVVSMLVVKIPSRPDALCGGFIVGGVGDEMMKIALSGCIDNSTTGLHYLQTEGTATLLLDPDRAHAEPWTVEVATYFGIAIRNFTQGVFDSSGDGGFPRVISYAGLLSIAPEKDSDSLNKYAAVYKHCDLYKVAQPYDEFQRQEVDFAVVEQRTTVSLSEWGLTIVLCWSLTLWMTATCLLKIADRKGMPKNVAGEKDIGRRWAAWEYVEKSDNYTSQSDTVSSNGWFHRLFHFNSRHLYLNVVHDEECDDIVACRVPVQMPRDSSKPFKDV